MTWRHGLRDRNARLDASGLKRSLRPVGRTGRFVEHDGRRLINLASNDYLGLAQDPRLEQAAIEATRRDGVSATASRLTCGHGPDLQRLEDRLAAFKGCEAALFFPTGYMANVGVLSALAGPDDLVCADKLCHASILDAIRLSGATLRVMPHRGHAKLERLLARSMDRRRRLIVTDSVFSMDGDVADLPRLCDLAAAHDAILVVDDAHGTGVLGPKGRGLPEAQSVEGRVDVVVGTASKALAGLGGFVAADRLVIDTIVNDGRAFVYTTAPPPAQVAVAAAALDLVEAEPWRRRRLAESSRRVRQAVDRLGLSTVDCALPTPIVPLITGSVPSARRLSEHLETAGFFAPPIRPPTVPPGSSRVRLALRADLEDDEIERLCQALARWPLPSRA